ncbi:MAG: helix-turn-helix domain-containing protein [Myxococcota bacterium]
MPIDDPEACPVRYVLDRIGDTWSLVTLIALSSGPTRYMGLLRTIDGITKRMLTRTLSGLAEDGLIERTASRSVPPAVSYALTPLGVSLVENLQPLISWSRENGEELRGRLHR